MVDLFAEYANSPYTGRSFGMCYLLGSIEYDNEEVEEPRLLIFIMKIDVHFS